MTLLSKTTIMLAGKPVSNFKEIRLHQKIHTHHILEARFPWQVFEEEAKKLGEKSKDFLGETFSVQISTNFKKEKLGEHVFKGIVTGINIIKGANTQTGDEIVLIAASQDIIADDGPNYSCFHEEQIGAIVKKTLEGFGFKLKVDSTASETINYVVQHNESAYQFIQRLSEQYGQWLYYNGEELVFGKPETKETELRYKFDLKDYKINLIPQSQKFEYFTQDYLQNKVQKDGKPHKPDVSGNNATVYDKSNKIFKNSTNVWVNTNSEKGAKSILQHKAKVQQESLAINQVRITGNSENSNVVLGNIVKIEGIKYRVVQVNHFVNRSGHYENKFEGVSASQEGYPHTNINAFPISQSQIAKVIDTNDPEGIGRIKVSFAWQDLIGETSPWIRVLTPSAGEGQGIQFLPEVGDEVMVDFEGGDAESPYVIGAMYHKNKKPGGDWGSSGNDMKVIRTRGGHQITFKDKGGDESITIEDKEGNKILLDTKNKEISVTSSLKLNITAGSDIDITAGGKLSLNAGTDLTIDAGTKLTCKAGTELSAAGGVKAELKAPQVGIKGDATAKLEGAIVDINGSGMTNVKGGIVNLN